jgi:ABC-type transporter Mla subunit MlaD
VNENNSSTMSFDRMRNMLNRAAEVRESEQQQIFDALDEIHARLQPVESLGAVRKRLSELPDRTEVSVLAERLDEALSKLEAQDTAIAGLSRSVDSMVDKLAKPFAQLDGRLDGVSGRFEGVAGRMDGLEDKLSGIHKRIDDVHGHLDKQDGKLDALPREVHVPLRERLDTLESTLRGRVDEVGEGVHEHLDGTREALYRSVTESTAAVGASVDKASETLHGRFTQAHGELAGKITEAQNTLHSNLNDTREALHSNVNETRDALHGGLSEAREALHAGIDGARDDVSARIEESRDLLDPSDRLVALTDRLEQVTSRLDAMAARLDAVESGIGGRLGELAGSVEQGLHKVHGTLSSRPDTESIVSLVRNENEESERRNAGQLDEAMATFAELILGGGGGSSPPPPPTALPRQQRRARGPKQSGKTNGKELDLADDMAEGA